MFALGKAVIASSAFALASAATVASTHAAACGSNGICVETKQRGNVLLVRYTSPGPTTHVNVIPVVPAGGQFEVGAGRGQFTLPLGFESVARYKIQACARGGIGSRSTCTKWSGFRTRLDR